jgi:hypothetical protein
VFPIIKAGISNERFHLKDSCTVQDTAQLKSGRRTRHLPDFCKTHYYGLIVCNPHCIVDVFYRSIKFF